MSSSFFAINYSPRGLERREATIEEYYQLRLCVLRPVVLHIAAVDDRVDQGQCAPTLVSGVERCEKITTTTQTRNSVTVYSREIALRLSATSSIGSLPRIFDKLRTWRAERKNDNRVPLTRLKND